jgi:hypothetical protein
MNRKGRYTEQMKSITLRINLDHKPLNYDLKSLARESVPALFSQWISEISPVRWKPILISTEIHLGLNLRHRMTQLKHKSVSQIVAFMSQEDEIDFFFTDISVPCERFFVTNWYQQILTLPADSFTSETQIVALQLLYTILDTSERLLNRVIPRIPIHILTELTTSFCLGLLLFWCHGMLHRWWVER